MFAKLVSETERANKAFREELLQNTFEYTRFWDHELEQHKKLVPDPIPHPDDIIIDMKTGEVRFTGPMTKEDKAKWERLWDRVEECDEDLTGLSKVCRLDSESRRGRDA